MNEKQKPLSKEGRTDLYINMGKVINDLFPILYSRINMLSKIQKSSLDNETEEFVELKDIIELHASVLYVIIEVATILRADIRSEIIIERKINLKYLVFITSEFYKATFVKSNSLWDKVSEFLLLLKNNTINNVITDINTQHKLYKNNYYDKDKNNRDISVHYDLDLNKLYNYIMTISEEDEAKRICSFLSFAQPLNTLLTSIGLDEQSIKNSNIEENKSEKYLLTTLAKRVYPEIGSKIQNFADYLDKNMHIYCIPDNLPKSISTILSEDLIENLKEKREYIKLTILLHYIYIDLGVAVRGFIASEYPIERRINLIRLNLIMYEGYKKIFLKPECDDESLWDKHIYKFLSSSATRTYKQELEEVNNKLSSFDNEEQIANIRHVYVHLREKKIFNLPELWSKLLGLSSFKELNKSLEFLKLLPQIIHLNCDVLSIITKSENYKTKRRLLKPFEDIKKQVLESNKSQDDKEEILHILNDIMDKIMNIIEKRT